MRSITQREFFVGFRADMIRFPEQKFSVICLANLSRFNPSVMARRVADIYLEDLYTEKSAAKKPAAKKPRSKELSEGDFKLTPDELKVYAGKYYSEELDASYILRLKKGKLFMQHENPHKNYPRDALKPTSRDGFRLGRFKLSFFRNEKKDIVGFNVDAGRVKNIVFEKR